MSNVNAVTLKQEYLDKKDSVLDLLKRVGDFYARENFVDKASVFSDLYQKLKHGEFSIVVVGEFSAGKSTMLNALMGKRLLPSFKNETTATVNFLRHTEKATDGEAGCVYYTDGETKILPQADLTTVETYVSTRGDNVAQSVDHLDLFLDSDFLRDGVMLVDSPGLNGIASGHREITEEQILKSHAGIFLFTADHPGSKTDFDVLRDLSKQVKTIFIVLNKIDLINPDEGETVENVIDTLKKNYVKVFGDDEKATVPEIWPVSAGMALKARDPMSEKAGDKTLEDNSRMAAFEARLMRFLTCGEKTRKELTEPLARIIAVAGDSKKLFEQEKEDLSGKLSGNEIEQQIEQAQAEVNALDEQISENRGKVRAALVQAFREIQNELSADISRTRDNKLKIVETIDDIKELNNYITNFEDNFVRAVQNSLRRSDERLKERIKDLVYTEYITYVEQIETNMDNIESVSTKFTLKEHLNTKERICDFDFDVMHKKEEELNAQLDELEKQNREMGDGEDELLRVREKKRKLEERLNQLHTDREVLVMRQLPPIGGHNEEVVEKRDRDGLLGSIWQIAAGKKEVRTTRYVEDRSEYDAAVADRDKRLKEKQDEIDNISGNTSAIEKEEAKSLEKRRRYLERRDRISRLSEQLTQVHKENIEEMEKKRKTFLRQCTRELRDFCDNIHDDLTEQARASLRKARDAYTTNVCEIIERNLRNSLQEKVKYLESVKSKLASSVAEKEQQMELLDKRIAALSEILNDTIDLNEKISAVETDIIEQTVVA